MNAAVVDIPYLDHVEVEPYTSCTCVSVEIHVYIDILLYSDLL